MSHKLHVYEGAEVTVTFDATRCIHHAHCVRSLPSVFNTAARPWVQPDAAEMADVLRAVAGCPTGALHATVRHTVSSESPSAPDALDVRLTRNGPLFLRGDVVVEDADGTAIVQDQRIALCRCGLSQRKPFCDNSHRGAGWSDAPPASESTG